MGHSPNDHKSQGDVRPNSTWVSQVGKRLKYKGNHPLLPRHTSKKPDLKHRITRTWPRIWDAVFPSRSLTHSIKIPLQELCLEWKKDVQKYCGYDIRPPHISFNTQNTSRRQGHCFQKWVVTLALKANNNTALWFTYAFLSASNCCFWISGNPYHILRRWWRRRFD